MSQRVQLERYTTPQVSHLHEFVEHEGVGCVFSGVCFSGSHMSHLLQLPRYTTPHVGHIHELFIGVDGIASPVIGIAGPAVALVWLAGIVEGAGDTLPLPFLPLPVGGLSLS